MAKKFKKANKEILRLKEFYHEEKTTSHMVNSGSHTGAQTNTVGTAISVEQAIIRKDLFVLISVMIGLFALLFVLDYFSGKWHLDQFIVGFISKIL